MTFRKHGTISGGWMALVVPFVFAAACGNSAEDCAETQTCISPGDEGGEANGGSSGTSSGGAGKGGVGGKGGASGASSGGKGGSSGTGGSGGTSGMAGVGGDDSGDAPSVVSVTVDGVVETEDVDTSAELVIEFSEPMAADTLTTDAISVTVAGHRIAGELTVNDPTHATFTPLERYYLLGAHTLGVTTDVTDEGGTALADNYEFSFRAREGAWTNLPNQTPAPLPDDVRDIHPVLGADGSGNVLVVWVVPPDTLKARWYRQGGGWEAVETLSSTLSFCGRSGCIRRRRARSGRSAGIFASSSLSGIWLALGAGRVTEYLVRAKSYSSGFTAGTARARQRRSREHHLPTGAGIRRAGLHGSLDPDGNGREHSLVEQAAQRNVAQSRATKPHEPRTRRTRRPLGSPAISREISCC